MTILGIDTSCDDTSAAVCQSTSDGLTSDTHKILSNIVLSQVLHSKYGGVIPELAARDHIKNIHSIVEQAVTGIGFHNINGIGVTYGPGLIGSLLVGLSFAKSLSYTLKIPFYGVNHLEAHIFSLWCQELTPDTTTGPEVPFIALIVSGGHTELILVKEKGEYELIGTTLDDAAGEAFDKVARMLGFSYPGGPVIQELAANGNPEAINFPRAEMPEYDFSFSGLKTAVLYYLRSKKQEVRSEKQDIAASFQEAVCDSLIDKVIKASKEFKVPRIGVAGGVAANLRLREKLVEVQNFEPLQVYFPKPEFCTDNAVMVALCANFYLDRNKSSPYTLKANSRASLKIG